MIKSLLISDTKLMQDVTPIIYNVYDSFIKASPYAVFAVNANDCFKVRIGFASSLKLDEHSEFKDVCRRIE